MNVKSLLLVSLEISEILNLNFMKSNKVMRAAREESTPNNSGPYRIVLFANLKSIVSAFVWLVLVTFYFATVCCCCCCCTALSRTLMRQKRNEEQNVLGIYLAIARIAWLCVGVRVYGCVCVCECVYISDGSWPCFICMPCATTAGNVSWRFL